MDLSSDLVFRHYLPYPSDHKGARPGEGRVFITSFLSRDLRIVLVVLTGNRLKVAVRLAL